MRIRSPRTAVVSLAVVSLAVAMLACGSDRATAPSRMQLEVRLTGPATPPAYLDGIRGGVDGSGIFYHTCQQVEVTATASGAAQAGPAVWGAARLTLRDTTTGEILGRGTFGASEVAEWWGAPTIVRNARQAMVWEAWAPRAFRATVEQDYTTAGRVLTASFTFTCAWRFGGQSRVSLQSDAALQQPWPADTHHWAAPAASGFLG